MENFIIVLLSIGFVVYNIYKNFQKEMQKSKSRKPNFPKQPFTTLESIPQTNSSKPKEIKSRNIEPVYITDLPEEVRAVQNRNKAQKQILTSIKEEETILQKNEIEFNLRQAVIQSAILERPYK